MSQSFKSLHYFLRNAAHNIKTPESTFSAQKSKGYLRADQLRHCNLDEANAISAFSAAAGDTKRETRLP
jgi:hypothetical protein